ncbi:MAG: AtzH-like domain-containing protein [Mycetocola sp.]
MTHTEVPVLTDATVPVGLIDAFWGYDSALLTNDVAALDDYFEVSADTLRGDGQNIVRGWEQISRFRASRTAIPTRAISTLHVRVLADDLVFTTAEVKSGAGSKGQQTQLWRKRGGEWRILAAHVTAPGKPIDTAVWRVVGAPLLPATASGPLSGDTVAVKDLFAVAGYAIGGGVRAYLPTADTQTQHSAAVAGLLEAGASITGIAQTDQFAYSVAGQNRDYGTPGNTTAPDRIPGGSTSGPAVAVARGEVSIGLGTDTAGSIRVPASYQGLWGIRTSLGLVSTRGLLPLAPSFDTVGWITRDGETLARVSASQLPASIHDAAGTRLVVIPALLQLASPAMRDAAERATELLGVDTLAASIDVESWFSAFRTVQAFEAWSEHGDWITAHPDALGPEIGARFAAASSVSQQDFAGARVVVQQARTTLNTLLAGRTLVLPTTADLPPLLNADAATIDDDRARTLRLTSLASLAGLPAVTAPVLNVDGLPSGLSFVGQVRTDKSLIALARRAAETILS